MFMDFICLKYVFDKWFIVLLFVIVIMKNFIVCVLVVVVEDVFQ